MENFRFYNPETAAAVTKAGQEAMKQAQKYMSERTMFELSFQRPSNYFKLSGARQWEIDKSLGILDWIGGDLSDEDQERFQNHYDKPKSRKKK